MEVNRNGERALARGSRSTASELELEFVTQTQDMKAGDLLVSSGMGQVYPKNYPVAEIVSVYSDPGQDFATVKARPLAQLASTRHVMLVFANEETVLPEFELDQSQPMTPDGQIDEGLIEEQLTEEPALEPAPSESQVSQLDTGTANP